MNWKRIVRDTSILLLMCGTFYVSSIVIGQLDADTETEESSFTQERLKTDKLIDQADWEPASEVLKDMTVKDPYDGYAWYRLGVSYLHQRMDTQDEIDFRANAGATKLELEPLELQLAVLDRQAIETLEKSKTFLRYRGKSILHLACVFAQRNEFETAMDHLQTFVDEGNRVYNGLAQMPELGEGGTDAYFDPSTVTPDTRLHQFHRFWRIVRQEYHLRSERRYRGRDRH